MNPSDRTGLRRLMAWRSAAGEAGRLQHGVRPHSVRPGHIVNRSPGDIVYTEAMPWMATSATEQRLRFVENFASGQWSMTELCERYGVTRPSGYKWVGRFREAGTPGLTERSRAPHGCPHRTAATIEALILAARADYG